LKDFPTNLLPLLKLKIFKSILLFALSVCYFKCTLVPEALCKAKETRGKNGEPHVTSGPYHQGAVRLMLKKVQNIQRKVNKLMTI
jgi:hypothetical protein